MIMKIAIDGNFVYDCGRDDGDAPTLAVINPMPAKEYDEFTRLIASAPDLLEACKMMADRLDFCGNIVYFGDTPDDMYIFDPNDTKMIEQAIERAEG